ncbi:MAG: NAD(P)-dependent oxidoreductase [Deltaproteobacteria bacterium]|nr:NAD(P)-dependent oxidoreductase [Deltaproteobacteria bacterium]
MNNRVGFIGLGQMGKWMALNVMKAGFDLTVFDINPKAMKFLTDEGAKSVQTSSELAGKVDWVFLSLPDTAAVERVIFGEDGLVRGAKHGLIVVDLSTTGYLPTQDFARRLKELGIIFADAPVSGAEPGAQKGTLTIMFGGDETIFDLIHPAFEAMGSTILHMGVVGSGQLTKVVNNLLYNINIAAIAEVLPMAVKLGLDPEKIRRVITTGTSRSFATEYFTPLILENRFDQAYSLNNAYKDMISAAEISAYHKIPLPLVHAATTTYQVALAEGYGDQDKGAMIKVFERILGVKFRSASQKTDT